MNRLKGLTCYLSGAIDYSIDSGKGWRDEITPFLESMNVKVFNPLKPIFYGANFFRKINRDHLTNLLKDEKWEEVREEVKNVNRMDLRAVDLSSFLIVNYDITVHMCGTYEEIFLADRQNKPVLMVVNDKRKLPLWIYGRLSHSHMFENWEDLKKYLNGVNSDPYFEFDIADTKRWLFFIS